MVVTRCVLVWCAVSALTAGVLLTVNGSAFGLLHTDSTTPFDELLVRLCAVAVAAAMARLWLITTVTVWDTARGILPRKGGITRHIVRLLCGVALTAGLAAPAMAQSSTPPGSLVGLALPDRAVSAAPLTVAAPSPEAPDHGSHVVEPGDSLWSIARQTGPPAATTAAIDARWRQIWALNRDVVGTDPDLIHPGQQLRLPDHTDTTNDSDGGTR